MKLLFIVDDYLPFSTKVAAKMMHELALEFQKNGHQITVLTPDFGLGENFKIDSIDGITVLYFKSGKIKNTNKIRRGLNESRLSHFAWKSVGKYLIENPHEGIVFYSPSIFWGGIVKRLKAKWRVNSYLILRDIFPQWAVDNGLIISGSTVHKYFTYFENKTYQQADKIGVMSPLSYDYFNRKNFNTDKFEVLYNWSKIQPVAERKTVYREKLNLQNKIVFFYGGNIGHAQNMANLTNLATAFKQDERAHFVFVGKGDEVELILSEIEANKLNNVSYLPPVDQFTYEEMLHEFDIGMFSLHPGHTTHNFPGKLLGYMLFEKPILGSVNHGNDLMELINEAEAGFVFENGEDKLLFNAALDLLDSEELRVNMGKKGKILLQEKFSVQNAAKQILKFYTKS